MLWNLDINGWTLSRPKAQRMIYHETTMTLRYCVLFVHVFHQGQRVKYDAGVQPYVPSLLYPFCYRLILTFSLRLPVTAADGDFVTTIVAGVETFQCST